MANDDVDFGTESAPDAHSVSSPANTAPKQGFDGLMNQTVNPGAPHNPTSSELLDAGGTHNPKAPPLPGITGNVTIVDPAAMRQVIKIYDDEIAALTADKRELNRVTSAFAITK